MIVAYLYCRLFDIGDELTPNYHLATVQKVNEYPIALIKAMPRKEIVDLADGSVDVQKDQFKIRYYAKPCF